MLPQYVPCIFWLHAGLKIQQVSILIRKNVCNIMYTLNDTSKQFDDV